MKPTYRLSAVILLVIVGAALSWVLLLQHHGEALGEKAVAEVCGPADQSGCDVVNQSAYSTVAGVPLAALGIFFYFSVGALAVIALTTSGETRNGAGALSLALFALSLAIDVVLFGIQALSIKAFCKLCITTYAANAAAIALLLPFRHHLLALRTLAGSREARAFGIAWIVASAGFAAGVGGTESALAQREAHRKASILGEAPGAAPATPAPAPDEAATAPVAPPTPLAPGAPADAQLKAAQAEIKRLQGIMDDPQKYDRYLSEKDLREFATGKAHAINLEDSPVKGPREAPIKVAEYSDYLCPFCRNLEGAFMNYVPQAQGRVAIYYKFYPLDTCNPTVPKAVHPGACLLAQGAVCAMEQRKFGPYHAKVLSTELHDPGKEDVVKLAREAGVDEAAFSECLESPRAKQRVLADVNEGTKAGVTGTPGLFINGRRLARANDFLEAVDQESQRLGLGPMPKPPAPPQH